MFKGISMGSLVLILGIVLLVFGTKRLRSMGRDVAEAIKDFRQGMQDDKAPNEAAAVAAEAEIDVEGSNITESVEKPRES